MQLPVLVWPLLGGWFSQIAEFGGGYIDGDGVSYCDIRRTGDGDWSIYGREVRQASLINSFSFGFGKGNGDGPRWV